MQLRTPAGLSRLHTGAPARAPRDDRRLLAIIALGVIAVLLLAAFNVKHLPFAGEGTTYHAAIAEANGLKPGDVVRVAGVKAGAIDSLAVRDGHVDVAFHLTPSVRLGNDTRVAVRIETLLGQQFLDVEPRGSGRLQAGGLIPLARTTPAYTLQDAVTGLTHNVESLDTAGLTDALNTLTATVSNTGPQAKAALDGLSRLSRTLSSRDAQLATLLQHAHGVAATVAGRDQQLAALVHDSNQVLTMLDQRREVIHQLLVSAQQLAAQLSGLVHDNEQQLGPALTHLHHVVDVLQANSDNIDRSLQLEAAFLRYFTNLVGNGRWVDSYLGGVAPVPPKPDLTPPSISPGKQP